MAVLLSPSLRKGADDVDLALLWLFVGVPLSDAWVLWTRAVVGSPGEAEWTVTTATPTLDQCRDERSKTIASVSKLWAPPSLLTG